MQPVRGTHDLLPPEFRKHSRILNVARGEIERAGFEEMATPLMEFRSVFDRTLGDTSDIVTKEMYEIHDRMGEGNIVLRPEGTAGAARAVMSNGLTQSLPLKYFYQGSMFRYERPQKGRLRQFHQMGVELMGVKDPRGDLEVILLAWNIFNALGLESRVQLEINTLGDVESRNAYRSRLLEYLSDFQNELSQDSQIRLQKNPLRILDSKDPQDKEITKNAPKFSEHLNNLSKEFFGRVLEGLEAFQVPFTRNENLVRGLDYYCHTAFEFTTTELGSQGTVLAGGRYDGLFPMMGGPLIPSVGWAGGLDRIAMMLEDILMPRPYVMIAGSDPLMASALKLADLLRHEGFIVDMSYQTQIGKALKYANKISALGALILGEDESQSGVITFKNLDSGDQSTVPQGELVTYLKEMKR
ncbi:Histidine--tRNA ligase [Candidatus Bealeia paramacronuclearis]|uniref:Histidine--tRNA ligase n=1 Tax=Candidatus Bealeia paramacronuclearis TaxID=1921001 RepID=A0ABZ2C3F0_9PROT|nr:Histidine--tRNA ligase [Candidatus Bealeia paramacronuclearis]